MTYVSDNNIRKVPLESINTILQNAKGKKTSYCPDMTIIYKSFDIKKNHTSHK